LLRLIAVLLKPTGWPPNEPPKLTVGLSRLTVGLSRLTVVGLRLTVASRS
jgi:hypothetical protein